MGFVKSVALRTLSDPFYVLMVAQIDELGIVHDIKETIRDYCR